MLITDIKRNVGNNIGHVGLTLLNEMAWFCGLDTLVDRLEFGIVPQIKERKFLRTLVNLMRPRKSHSAFKYSHILYFSLFYSQLHRTHPRHLILMPLLCKYRQSFKNRPRNVFVEFS